MRISFTRLWTDSDEMLEIRVALEGHGFAAFQDIYVYPDAIKEFGSRLQSFPNSLSDEPQLEIGSLEPNAYCWFKLCAYVFDRRGHSALELSINSNGDRQVSAQSRFSVVLEPASLNFLGSQLQTWSSAHDIPLIFECPEA